MRIPTLARWSSAVALLGGALALALAGCDSKSAPAPGAPATALTTVRLQLNWVPEPEFGGFYAAQQDGLFTAQGLNVELVKGASGTPTAQMAASGTVEFAVVSGDQVLSLRERGGDLVALFTVFHTSPMGVMVKKDAPWQDLKQVWTSDLTVAMEAGLPYVKFLNAAFGAGKVKIVPTGSGLAAFERGTVQAQQCFIAAEPVQMDLQGVPVRVFSLAASGYDPYTAVVATRRQYLQEHRAECERFVRACREGWTRYLAKPEAYNPGIAALNPAMSVKAMDVAAGLQHNLVAPPPGSADPVGWMSAERWERLESQMKELGLISAAPDGAQPPFWNPPAQ